MGRPAQESSTAGSCRKSPSSRNYVGVQPHARQSAQSAMSSCVISSTTSQSSFCALPPRTYLRTQRSAVCAPGSARSSASWTPGAPPHPALAASPQFPVPGRPVSSRELPARQWPAGSSTFHLRCLGRSASMRGALPPAPAAAPRSASAAAASAGSPSSPAPGSAAARPGCAGPWPPCSAHGWDGRRRCSLA